LAARFGHRRWVEIDVLERLRSGIRSGLPIPFGSVNFQFAEDKPLLVTPDQQINATILNRDLSRNLNVFEIKPGELEVEIITASKPMKKLFQCSVVEPMRCLWIEEIREQSLPVPLLSIATQELERRRRGFFRFWQSIQVPTQFI
jgi:hypothetical protein